MTAVHLCSQVFMVLAWTAPGFKPCLVVSVLD